MARHNVDNKSGFTGFSLKNTVSDGFGFGELLSFGFDGAVTNDSFWLTDSSEGFLAFDFDMELRVAEILYDASFNAFSICYPLNVTVNGNTLSTSGVLISSGPVDSGPVVSFDAVNFNPGVSQDFIFDSTTSSAVTKPPRLLTFGWVAGLNTLRRRG